jgi:hypothetical protein
MQFHKSVVQRMMRGPDGKISKISIMKQHNGKKGIILINKNGKKEVKKFKIKCKPKRKTRKLSKVNRTEKKRKRRKKKMNSINNAGNTRKSFFKKKRTKKKRKTKKTSNNKGFWHNFWGV